MSFHLTQLDNGIKVTTGLRHLGFWLKDSLARVLGEVADQPQTIYLDLGNVSYVDETISRMIQEARINQPNLQLVGFPRKLSQFHARIDSQQIESIVAA